MTGYDLKELARNVGYIIVGAIFVSAIVAAIYCMGRFGFAIALDFDKIAEREIPYSAAELHGLYIINGLGNAIVVGFLGIVALLCTLILWGIGETIVTYIKRHVQTYARLRRIQRLRR